MSHKNFLKVFLSGLLSGIASVLVIFVIVVMSGKLDISTGKVSNSKEYNNILTRDIKEKSDIITSYIDKYYIGKIDSEKMSDSVYKGIVDGLDDKYAAYYTSDEYKEITEKSDGVYCGIGAYVTQNVTTGAITIVRPMPNGPADKAGIKAGDIICAVDGTDISGKDLTEVLSLVKGEKGSAVNLKIYRKGEKDYIDIKVIRDEIEEDTVSYKMLDDKIGYIQVTGFEAVTVKQFNKAVDKLEKKGEKALIIDLRDNGGGLLDTAVKMLDRILPKELVVYTKDKQGKAEEYYAKDNKKVSVPIAILVNENSASASEVFAGALQDYGVAKLVGTKTFGKGIVQSIFNLTDGTALKMTVAKYYTPKGRNIHEKGLTPDVKVTLNDKTTVQNESKLTIDNQMQKAINILKKR